MYLTLKFKSCQTVEAFDKSRDKLAEDPQWQAYSEHRSALSADTRAYDDSIGWTEPKEQE